MTMDRFDTPAEFMRNTKGARAKVGGLYRKVTDRAGGALASARDNASEGYDEVEFFLRNRPVLAIGIAVGVAVGAALLLDMFQDRD